MRQWLCAIVLTCGLAGGVYYAESAMAERDGCCAQGAAAKCTGSKSCTACKNCKYCAHCKGGGTCGVCAK